MAHLRDNNSPIPITGRPFSGVVLTDEEREILRQQTEEPVPEFDPDSTIPFFLSCHCEWCVLERAAQAGKITFDDKDEAGCLPDYSNRPAQEGIHDYVERPGAEPEPVI